MSNTKFIFGIIIFYSILSIFLFSYGMSGTIDLSPPAMLPSFSIVFPLHEAPEWYDYVIRFFQFLFYALSWTFGLLLQLGFFIKIIFFTILGLPWWLNLLIFTPIGLTMLWITLELIRG
jgi:hypothetical protein